ncbi:hypothetical protein GCM10022243_68280 [Saccharothrix violaceirubra]|uniref:Uncharacterized protein n=1 Tax=Saccharothrix violaceirubra TaxID=413306 RepID=A0A7W7WXA4_9PSEU|nr:hypothetical protein [Saccharothrix violaceirubra]MBB4967234.1 hypothetical protein [Saccharothrix violaceirubra]
MSTVRAAGAALPRGLLIAQAWGGLGDAVAPLSGAAGRPLARTVKLILDPLVLRPVLNPGFAAGAVAMDHVDALRDRIVAAGPVLAATAAWFLVVKKERRRRGITEGNPQDLYFQRCFELATAHGDPADEPDLASTRAAGVLAEVHDRAGPTVGRLRDFVADHVAELDRLLEAAWTTVPVRPGPEPETGSSATALSTGTRHVDRTASTSGDPAEPEDARGSEATGSQGLRLQGTDVCHSGSGHVESAAVSRSGGRTAVLVPGRTASLQVPTPPPGDSRAGSLDEVLAARIGAFLDGCATRPDAGLFGGLLADRVGSSAAVGHRGDGVAREQGLTDLPRPVRPVVGDTASKKSLPKPFDRSIVERLFGALSGSGDRDGLADVPDLVRAEISRSASPWQLGTEAARVTIALGRAAAGGLTGDAASTDAAARLRSRWEREAYVHRVLRMPDKVPGEVRADVLGVCQAYLRRLWVRVHGRELRGEDVGAADVWDLLDGVLRSVVLDQRDRLRSALERRDGR